MAGLGDKITVVIDVVTNKATQGLKDFRSAVAEAQGFTGKLKAGVGSLKDTFAGAVTSPAAMGAAVAAAGKFAADAVAEYTALGVTIADFAAATGLAAEDASRWVEVSGDLNIEAGVLQAAIGKLNKSIDPAAFDKLSIAISRTADGAVDVNGTFLNVIDRLRDIRDPAEQARVGAQLLGKGWQSVAPLISRSAKNIKDQLDGVAEVKVFTDDELKQAQNFDAAMKNLQDALQEVALKLGQDLIPVLEKAAETAGLFSDLGAFDIPLLDNINSLIRDTKTLFGLFDDTPKYTMELTDELLSMGDAAAQSQRYLGLLAEHTRESADAATDLTGNARLAREQLKLLQDQIDGRKSFIDLQIGLRDNAQRIKDLAKQFADGKISAEDYYLGVASLALDSQNAVADYVAEVDDIPEKKKLELVTTLDPASPGAIINGIQTALDAHTFNAKVETDIETRRGSGGPMTPVVPQPQPPRRQPPPGGVVTESVDGFGRSSSGVTVVVNAPVGANLTEAGRQVADALRAYYRNGGDPV